MIVCYGPGVRLLADPPGRKISPMWWTIKSIATVNIQQAHDGL